MNETGQPKTLLKESAQVAKVVQEYMDTLLVDFFPDVAQEIEQKAETETAVTTPEAVILDALTLTDGGSRVQASPHADAVKSDIVSEALPKEAIAKAAPKIEVKPERPTVDVEAPSNSTVEVKTNTADDTETQVEAEPEVASLAVVNAPEKPLVLRYPEAPAWAQQAFDVLLFDVCGLKLAVPMESLGKIIKIEHETNQLIGRPSWFVGAYIDGEQHLYVVDTAQYIMPEKGFNLVQDGFGYVIQLQRSKWTLACKKVHSTVRLEPDQVKWRSSHGKRQWLSGTVVDHMCALIHVDSLIDLLEAEAS